EAAFAEWSRVVRQRQLRARMTTAGLIAAGIVIVLAAALLVRPPADLPAHEVARLDAHAGDVTVLRAGSIVENAARRAVRAADRIQTGGTGLARLTAGTVSIRLRHDTSVQIEPHRVILTRGTVYIDAGRESQGTPW